MPARRRRFESWGLTPPACPTAGPRTLGARRGSSLCVDHLIFLDANVLYCAAYRRDAGLRRLWTLPVARLITSVYAAEEARRNLSNPGQRSDLEELLGSVEVVPTAAPTRSSAPFGPGADRQGSAHSAVGDQRRGYALAKRRLSDFRPYYGERIEGVLILS